MMQVIKYKWQDWKPQLIVRSDGGTEKIPLIDNEIRLTIGKKICIGFTRDGRSYPCRNGSETEDWMCNGCKLEDDYYFCVKCDGSQCINEKKRSECEKNSYFVYLAAFDSMLKVGISHEFRLMERLVEQGADFGAKIARVRDGKLVRSMEQQIKKEIDIADRVTGEQKHKMLFGNPNISVASIFRAIALLRSNGFAKHMISPEIYDLRQYYGLNKVASYPAELRVEDGTKIHGTAVSAKGNIVIVKNGPGFFSFNAHRLLGREITI